MTQISLSDITTTLSALDEILLAIRSKNVDAFDSMANNLS